ncbi:unnamed protein product [Urochloa humidicola]
MRTRADDTESLRRQLIVVASKVIEENLNASRRLQEITRLREKLVEEKLNVTRGMEEIVRLHEELIDLQKSKITALKRTLEMEDELRDKTDVLQKKEAEIQELKVQKQAELQKVKVQKGAEVQKVINENIRLLRTVNKKEAQLQAMSEHCKLLALMHHN